MGHEGASSAGKEREIDYMHHEGIVHIDPKCKLLLICHLSWIYFRQLLHHWPNGLCTRTTTQFLHLLIHLTKISGFTCEPKLENSLSSMDCVVWQNGFSWSCLELMNLMFELWCSNKKALAKKLPEIFESSSICMAVVYTNPGDFYHGTIWADILTSHILYRIWVGEDASIDHLTRCVISPPKWAPTVIWIWELMWRSMCCC